MTEDKDDDRQWQVRQSNRGGEQMSTIDAQQDLERIRQARDDDDDGSDESDSPKVHTCPIDGCSRTVVGNPAHLRSHVRQAGDDAHRGITLNEDLEIEESWGPGVPEDTADEIESIYKPGDPWGPGPPK